MTRNSLKDMRGANLADEYFHGRIDHDDPARTVGQGMQNLSITGSLG